MTSQSGGGSGYPGVTSESPNSLIVDGRIQAGDLTAPNVPDFSSIRGATFIRDVPGNNVDGDTVLSVSQLEPVPSGGFGPPLLYCVRQGNISAQDYNRPMVQFIDTTASVEPIVQFIKQNVVMLELGVKPAVIGALSSITDANAKAVLTSILAALTGVKVVTDSTT